jgi:hypothetical protein
MPSSAVAPVVVANFSQFRLEPHVEKSLQKAWKLSDGRPLNASELIQGALLVARTGSSKAFKQIASLVPLPSLRDVKATEVPPANLAALPLTKPLADSLHIAESFLKEKGGVWGRDYLSIALLAKDDPSLAGLTSEAKTTVETVRDAWFYFVSSTDERRTAESWKQWWRSAGVPLPAQATPTAALAHLFVWDPRAYPFPRLEEYAGLIEKQGFCDFTWSTGNTPTVNPGARVFLLKREEQPAGLVAVGDVQGSVMDAPHWDPAKQASGETSLLANVRWKALSREPFLDQATLDGQLVTLSSWLREPAGTALPTDVSQKLDELWPRAWAEYLQSRRDIPAMDPRDWIARLDADRGVKRDSLNLESYVNSFARVIASRSLGPPLSIGLFGDWGTGKTFFMDRLYDKIEELRNSEGSSTLYWKDICQIRFNAWHYAETNLWASLVSTIFNDLRSFLDGPQSDADEFNKLMNQLEVAGELRKEAEKKVADAATQHAEAQKRLADAEKKLGEVSERPLPADQELRKILSSTLVPSDRQAIIDSLQSAAEYTGREDFRKAADQLKKGELTAESAAALLDEANTFFGQAGFWWRVLSAAKIYRSPTFWAVIFALLVIPAVFVLASWRLGLDRNWAHLWTVLAEILTAAGAMIGWMRSRLADATSVFDRLNGYRTRVARGIEEARNKDRQAYEAQREWAVAEEQRLMALLEGARREVQRTSEEERKAREALRDSTSQARLGKFIRERASAADYEKHLGLIAMIHRDFDRLSKLMEKQQQEEGDADLPRIDRIVLYIDDLDRCYPPDKVVKVLEAVHLLLFFPLFVVVVGVDSRWLSRSLHVHYGGMLEDEAITREAEKRAEVRAGGSTDGQNAGPVVRTGAPPATSQNFLEKIFQVPFWLRVMDPAAVQRLVHSLISTEELEVAPEVVQQAPALGATAGVAAPMPVVPGGGTEHVFGTTPDSPARAATRQITAEAETERHAMGEALAAPAEALKITELELAFMDKVSPLMPRTPRAVKRFVNIYRLYKAGLSPVALARFLGTPVRAGNYQAVQVLLALVTGTPLFAERIFQELREYEGDPPKRLLDLANVTGDEPTWKTTSDALREFCEGDCNLPLEALKDVSGLVARYSLHNMVVQTPGEAGLG